MANNDAVLRSCLVWLAAIVVVVGLYTHSLKKMAATYFVGMFALAGVLLPDWEFFDRDFSQWNSPVSVHDQQHNNPSNPTVQVPTTPKRFRFYPIRVGVYTVVYSFAFYKWWIYISS